MELTDILTQPVAVATAVGATLLQLLGVLPWVDPVVTVLFANIGTVFTALSLSGLTIAPEVAWLPEDTLTTLTLIAAGLYVLKLLGSLTDKIRERMEDDTN
jgi:hypothetical protein